MVVLAAVQQEVNQGVLVIHHLLLHHKVMTVVVLEVLRTLVLVEVVLVVLALMWRLIQALLEV
jgi:hypothetical protein